MRVVLAAAAWAAMALTASGKRCSAEQKLKLNFVENRTAFEDLLGGAPVATCADGSQVGYFINEDDVTLDRAFEEPNKDFIIWLGDTQTCAGSDCDELCDGVGDGKSNEGTVCAGFDDELLATGLGGELSEDQARCLYSRAICTSEWWRRYDEITPQTILCRDDAEFGRFRRVFLPSCTLDWWLGQGVSGSDKFRGNLALKEIIYDLAFRYNLTFADNIVIGGTRGGAVATLNNIKLIKSLISSAHESITGVPDTKTRSYAVVLDSAWFYNGERFTPTSSDLNEVFALRKILRDNAADWINTAAFNPECIQRWNITLQGESLLYRCFLASEIIKDLADEKLFFIQSLYDLIQLEDLGLLDKNAVDQYQDAASYASSAISFIETFGQSVRSDIQQVVKTQESAKHFFYTTPCGQHGYIVPTSLHSIDPRVEAIGDYGSIRFQRNFEVWETKFFDLSVKESIIKFIETKGDAISSSNETSPLLLDSCGTFLCRDDCPTKVLPYEVLPSFSQCSQFMVLGYAVSLLLLFYVSFLINTCQVSKFNRTVRNYWKQIKLIEAATGNKEEQIKEVQQQLLNEAASAEYRRIHLMVQNLSYWAPAKTRRGKPHQILDSCDLAFPPGQVHAIMGPSGSGKSTLLDILALTRDNGSISGSHYINGVPSNSKECKFLREWLKHNSSYVRQSDVLFPMLTVREHLVHAAWLMLPQYMSSEAKLRRVWQVLRLLELDSCADTICGDGGVTVEGGISGGQRRRVSVATQLLKMPAVLLLDEPTSGLDSTNALLLVKALHTFAHEGGVNVLMTIHQPRKEIFEYLDSLSFLVSGRVVFSGQASAASMHFRLPAASKNIANDILDVLQTCDDATTKNFEQQYLEGPLGQAVQENMEAEITELTPELISTLKEVLVENSLAEGRWSWSESSSASMLSWVLMSRTFKRGGFDILTTSILALVGGVLVGILFLGNNSYTARTALAYLAVATMTFLQGTFLGDRYLGEKQMYDHETDAGTFRNWVAFLISQFLRDCAAASIEGIMFAVPAYWIGGLNENHGDGFELVENFAIFVLLMILTSFVVVCQNVFIEVDRDDLRTAAMLQIGLLGLGALFNGFIVKLDDIPAYMSWIPYIMVTYWSFVGTLINDFAGLQLNFDLSVLENAARTGDVVLRSLSYNNRDVYICIIVLVIFVFVFRALAVIDFYIRYVRNRGKTMKRTNEGSPMKRKMTSPSGKTPLLRQDSPGKKTMDTMLEAQTPTMKRQESGLKRTDSSFSTPRGALSPKSPNVSSFHLTPGTPQSSVPDKELEFYAQDEVKLSFVQSGWISVILDRNLFLLWFLIDLYSSAYICGFEDVLVEDSRNEEVDIPVGMFAIGIGIGSVYVFYFFLQLFFLVPTVVDGKLDCTWAGGYDALGALTLIVDIALTIQSANSSSTFEVQLVLAGIIRVMRFIRVYVYWQKVDAFHAIRARSFLDLREELVEELAEANQAGSRISGFDMPSQGRPGLPPSRPNRAPRPVDGNASVPMTFNMTKRISHRLSAQQNQPGVPSRPARPAPARPQRPPRPVAAASRISAKFTRPTSSRQQAVDPSQLKQWRPLGNGYMYNPLTGQTVKMSQIVQRRAPPPPPPSQG